MKPTLSDVHVNKPLTNISVAFLQDQKAFIATRLFPIVPVEKQSDVYFTYSTSDLMRDDMRPRAPSTESAGSGYGIDNTANYYCKPYALHQDVSDQLLANADSPLKPESDATRILAQKMMIGRERLWATAYIAGSTWASNWQGKAATPGANEFLQWDAASSDPIKDIAKADAVIHGLTGFHANKLVVARNVYQILKNHSAVLDRVKYTQKGPVTLDLLAGIMDLDEVLVADGIYNSAAEGATASLSYIISKKALLCYSAPAPSIMAPSAGYCFSWKQNGAAGNESIRTKRFRMEHLAATRVESEIAFDFKLVSTSLGLYLYDVIA